MILVVLSILTAAAPAPSPAARITVDVVAKDEKSATPAELAAVRTRAEGAARAFERILGPALTPPQKIVVRLEGDAQPGQIPTVDPASGAVLLYRELGEGGAYEASLAHEMVHALRRSIWMDEKRQTDVFLFVEEGFAEMLAREAGFPSLGFPTYGVDVDVAAGAFVGGPGEVPMHKLVTEHRAWNFRCMPQAYTERLSFFEMLRRRFGIQKLVALAFAKDPLEAADFARVLGAPLDSLEKEWRAEALTRFHAINGGDAAARAFREKSPIRYLHACTAAEIAPK